MSENPDCPPPPQSVGIANYRSFDEEGFRIHSPKRINVLIGKNNVGKSNVLRALRLLGSLRNGKLPSRLADQLTDRHRREGKDVVVAVALPLGVLLQDGEPQVRQRINNFISKTGENVEVRWNAATGVFLQAPAFERLPLEDLYFLVEQLANVRMGNPPRTPGPYVEKFGPRLVATATSAVEKAFKDLLAIPVFREVRTKAGKQAEDVVFDGLNVIEMLRDMQHPVLGEEHKREVFDKLERFTRDLVGVRDLRLEVPPREDRLYLNMHSNRLPLENYGTGIHHLVILCAALAIHSRKVITVEEPEIHLHPELQRKFLRFIAEQTDNTYFITTHSNVFLDARPDVNVYHVRYDGQKSTVEHAATPGRSREVLTDMGYKASDLLQSNCVLWVEGPSDRIYLNKWLSLVGPELVEGIHYSVAFYGGALLPHFTASDEPVGDLIQVLRINRHPFVMMDRDGDDAAAELKDYKARILSELGPDHCWVTQGREVENYLRPDLIRDALSARGVDLDRFQFGPDDRIGESIHAAGGPKTYDKVVAARHFAGLMAEVDLDVLNLRDRLHGLVSLIRRWNRADAPSGVTATP